MNGFSTGEEDSRGPTDQTCCLLDNSDRCGRPAGNASYSKRIQKTVIQRRLQLSIDNSVSLQPKQHCNAQCTVIVLQARHIYICDYHKMIIQSARTKRKRKDSEDDSNETDTDVPEVDLFQLQVNTLRRYKRHFKVPTRPGINKAQLADVSNILFFCKHETKHCLCFRPS